MQVHVRVAGFDTVAVVPRGARRAPGSPVNLSVLPGKVHLFDAVTEQRIG
jgi:multiple sugar transport system ATP-binding protein